ncbi:hypothetical protein Bbelb_276560 [Branchiostoma belcheri]|nr:hypothetical protein Bbelb_276560 [Branchiostoma belcheri]
MYGADEIIVLVQYRSGICRRHLGKRAGPSRSIYRAVTGGHTVGSPKQARGALSIPFPRYSYKRSRRRHAQAGPCTFGRLNPFTVQSREVMPSARPSKHAGPCRYPSRTVTRGLTVGSPKLARGAV